MKNIVAGIFVFCGVLVTLWAVSHYRMVANQDRPPPQSDTFLQTEPPTTESTQPTAAIPPAIDDLALLSQESTVAASAPTSDTEGEQPSPPPAPLPTTEHSDQASDAIPAAPSVDNSPPSTGWGLLTDTGETEENRIDDPNAAMVKATTPRKTKPVPVKIPTHAVATADHQEAGSIASGDLPFSVLLATYDNRENAQKGAALYGKKGIAAYVVKVNLGDVGSKYRLFSGTFATAELARAFIDDRALRGKLVKHTPFTAVIGAFTDPNALTDIANKATAAGAFPYVLQSAAGPLHLVAGAFYTREGAEHQCRELTASGLPCTVAPRSTATTTQSPVGP